MRNTHIALNQTNNLKDFSNFIYEFATVINEISVEFISQNAVMVKN